jgi:hypothetical protein
MEPSLINKLEQGESGNGGQCANLDKMLPDFRLNSLPEDRRSAPSNIRLRAVTFMPFGKSSCVKR